jgi:hypothetical protein
MTEIAGHWSSDTQGMDAGEAEGARSGVPPGLAVPLPPLLVARLIQLQKHRRFAIRGQSSMDRRCDAFVAGHLGYHNGLSEKERKALFRQAAEIRLGREKQLRAYEKALRKKPPKAGGQRCRHRHGTTAPGLAGGEGQLPCDHQAQAALSACLPVIDVSIEARRPLDEMRAAAEKDMERIAETLAVWAACSEVAGFGALGLAVLVAEAGNDLSTYPHWYHLWKRLGLAPYHGRAMSSWKKHELTAKEWTDLGYSPRRRGTVAGDIGVALLCKKASNAYGAVYTARRAHTALTHPDWTKKHSDNDARRIMLKALIRDVWRWWRDAGQRVSDYHPSVAGRVALSSTIAEAA